MNYIIHIIYQLACISSYNRRNRHLIQLESPVLNRHHFQPSNQHDCPPLDQLQCLQANQQASLQQHRLGVQLKYLRRIPPLDQP